MMKPADAVVFLLFGQSNAVGHILPMRQEDKILEPMPNVFGLSRTLNQSFDNQQLYWSGYTSFGMNLGETQDDTYSIANCLAQLWQARINGGEELPDLYIIHIAIGAQGVTENFMWYPDREKKLIPGPLGVADIALYPFALHILSLLQDSFQKMDKTYEILGMHWLGGHEDIGRPIEELAQVLDGIYLRMFREMREQTGMEFPIVLHNLDYPDGALTYDPSGKSLKTMYYINGEFEYLSRICQKVHIFYNTDAPHYVPNVRGNGLYLDVDAVHHTEQTNRWIAQTIFEAYRNKD